MHKNTLHISICILLFVLPMSVHAATLSLIPEQSQVANGEQLTLDIVITSEVPINAAEATISFQNEFVEVVEVADTNSIFNFWVEEPTFSNEDGTITFSGGTAQGKSGAGLQVATIVFEAVGSGSALVSISDVVITAADGRGTNVVDTVRGAAIGVGVRVEQPEPVMPEMPKPEVVEPDPVPPSALSRTPSAPTIRIPLYADQRSWYNYTDVGTTVLWDIPPGITNVAFAFDQSPNTIPPTSEGQVLTGKTLGQLGEGIHYAHAQFKNTIGWGDTAHRRIAIDTTPPRPFSVDVTPTASDNPQPRVQFSTQDTLSGISHVRIQVDDNEPFKVATTTARLPVQKPGMHTVSVRVFDEAGNSRLGAAEFEILPIEAPSITFIDRFVQSNNPIHMSGTALSNVLIKGRILNSKGDVVWSGETMSDNAGNWAFSVQDSIPVGKYTASFTAEDERGAQSHSVESRSFEVVAQILLTIGGVILGWFEIILILLLIAAAVVWLRLQPEEKKTTRKKTSTNQKKK